MDRKAHLILLLIASLFFTAPALADSTRIEVYPLSQHYWDTQPGETLSQISAQLLPNNPGMQHKLMNDIINQNPGAFQDNDADYMLANTRLWLPNHLAQTDSKVNPERTRVESFSWGNVKRAVRY